jgi:N-acetylneuraminic acid mutarotase
VFGGEAPSGTFGETESYDPATNTWAAHARMPTPRHGLGAAVIGNRIFVISGGPRPGNTSSPANEIFAP